MGKKKATTTKCIMESFFSRRDCENAVQCIQDTPESKNEKEGADMNLVVVYVCVVIDHFMVSTVTAVSQYCLPVLYVRQDESIDRVKSCRQSLFSLGPSTSPNFCPTRTFCPACTPNSKSRGASKTSTIVLPRQNPPISCPGLKG